MLARSLLSLSLFTTLAACVAEPEAPSPEPTDAEVEVVAHQGDRPRRVQAGSLLGVLGVVGDDWAVYQDGGSIYATRLEPGAPRRLISDTTVNAPQVLVIGKVALIWPDQASFTSAVPGRLVIWTADGGARVASTRTIAPTNVGFFGGVALSDNGRSILFIDRVAADGSRGDLVLASTDLSERTTVATDVATDYVAGTCAPFLGFRRSHGRAQPLAAYCAVGEATATLATVDHGQPRILTTGLFATPRFFVRDEVVATIRADLRPLLIDRDGAATVVTDQRTGVVFSDGDDHLITLSRDATGIVIQRVDEESHAVQALTPALGLYQGHAPLGLPYYATDRNLSRDDRLLMFFRTIDPTTGLTDVQLIDVSHAPSPTVTLSATANCGQSFELFTRDSSHALFYCGDINTGLFSLYAGSLTSPARRLSTGFTAFQHFGLAGRDVVYADNVVFGPIVGSFDLKVADVADPDHQRTVVTGATTNFMVTADRRTVVYSRDDGAATDGLYALRLR